jgi:hypothetical protein
MQLANIQTYELTIQYPGGVDVDVRLAAALDATVRGIAASGDLDEASLWRVAQWFGMKYGMTRCDGGDEE